MSVDLSAVGEQRPGEGSCPLESQTEILNESPSEGDVADGAYGEAADDAMPRRLRACNANARKKVVDPFSLDIGDKASYINVIRRQR